ncbi:MAG: hypothetical protein O2839_05015 [Cyanobacteria bacterium]|nr:hypothetical protein [Cyanobacteriota bacterium]MDA1246337.1 hypothetical protein [Cyanobacteriota bacterium]
MTQPSRFSLPDRPDLGDRLLAAVAERDQAMAQRLVQQWAHRRGLLALEVLISGPLCESQGSGAAEWLRLQAGLEINPELPHETATSKEQPVVQRVEQRAVLALMQDALTPAAINAAPAPFAHASLRAWLPDAEELDSSDLPVAS